MQSPGALGTFGSVGSGRTGRSGIAFGTSVAFLAFETGLLLGCQVIPGQWVPFWSGCASGSPLPLRSLLPCVSFLAFFSSWPLGSNVSGVTFVSLGALSACIALGPNRTWYQLQNRCLAIVKSDSGCTVTVVYNSRDASTIGPRVSLGAFDIDRLWVGLPAGVGPGDDAIIGHRRDPRVSLLALGACQLRFLGFCQFVIGQSWPRETWDTLFPLLSLLAFFTSWPLRSRWPLGAGFSRWSLGPRFSLGSCFASVTLFPVRSGGALLSGFAFFSLVTLVTRRTSWSDWSGNALRSLLSFRSPDGLFLLIRQFALHPLAVDGGYVFSAAGNRW